MHDSTATLRFSFRKLFRNENFIGIVLALTAFCVYLATLAPSIGWEEDGGELAASFSTLGITHPTGYPLFTMLAWAFTHLPLGGRDIWKLNLLVAVLCALAVYLFFRLFVFLLSEKSAVLFPRSGGKPTSEPGARKGGKGKNSISSHPSLKNSLQNSETETSINHWSAAIAVLCLAFSATFWSEALSIEVYALHLAFFAGVTLLFLASLAADARGADQRGKHLWLVFALFLGLSFSHHMMTVLCLPAFAYLLVVRYGFGKHAWIRVGRGLVPFVAGLSAYLYIPLRAAQEPVMSWGDASTLSRFWFHVSAGQYRYKMFASLESTQGKLVTFVTGLPAQFGYVPLLLALVGLWALYRQARRLLVFSALLLLTSLVFSLNYGFEDPNFYLNAYVAVAVWIGFGVHALLTFAAPRADQSGARAIGRFAGLVLRVLCAACVAFPLALNYPIVNQRGNYAVEDYTRNILNSLEPGAVVLTGQYIYLSAPAYYLQLVEGVRPDVLILDTQMLKFPWAHTQIERRFPWLAEGSRPEINAFLESNARFEQAGLLDSAEFIRYNFVTYSNMIRSFLERSIGTRPVYVTTETVLHPDWGFRKLQAGMVFRLYRNDAPRPPPPRAPMEFTFRPLPPDHAASDLLAGYYSAGYLNQGLYYALGLHDTTTGIALIRRAVAVRPDFVQARQWLQRIGG